MTASAPTMVNFATNYEQNHHVLHVTAASTYKTKHSNDTTALLSEIFFKKNNTNNDIWLIGIDILDGQEDIHEMYFIFLQINDEYFNLQNKFMSLFYFQPTKYV